MSILFYLIPLVFLSLTPSRWKDKLFYEKKLPADKEKDSLYPYSQYDVDRLKEKQHQKKKEAIYFIVEQVTRFIVGIFYAWIVLYINLADNSFGAFFIWTILWVAISLFVDAIIVYSVKVCVVGGLVFLIWLGSIITIYSEFTKTSTLFNMINAEVTDKKQSEIDVEHIRFVPMEYAKYKGDKLYSEIPNFSWYEIGEYSLQKIDTSLYWVAPIEFAGIFKYNSAKYTPGYIIVSAEDKNADAKLIKDYKMKYTPSAYFSHNLQRIIRDKYPNIIIGHSSFEPDDSGKPFYAVSYGHYEAFRSAFQVDGVVVVDAETGEMEKYKVEDVPAYIDQVFPESVALDYSEYYGKYANGGWWNALTSQNGVTKPTTWGEGQEIAGVVLEDNNLYYFTDHTTAKSSDSMVGYTLINARNGNFTYFVAHDSLMNAQSALDVVNNTMKTEQWHGTMPILYNIYGVDTWVIPILDNNHLFREIALVNARTASIAHGVDEEQVYQDYKNIIATMKEGTIDPTQSSKVSEISGSVKRMAIIPSNDKTIVKILLNNSYLIFNVDVSTIPLASFIQSGDILKIQYIDTGEQSVSIKELENISLK